MTTEKSIALTRWTFIGKVMYLLFNMLSRLVIAFKRHTIMIKGLIKKRMLYSAISIHSIEENNEDHGIWSHHFMGNRRGNSGKSVILYFFGLQNH